MDSETHAVQRHVRHWQERNCVIPDGVARTIAAWWQSSRDMPLAALTTSGAIDADGVCGSINAILRDGWVNPDEQDTQRVELHALRAYVDQHGDRGPVEGWSRVWATSH